ncbi:MAG: D-tyrosyl-tRNA(Tyr) deacylase [Chlorobiaceae bacterium]|jgi:D-aminoacyl-tRNA deacylase|nr:D-tyrosyl-tRNA(Tyr) deacylase [Chlorobiaceae bacterium]
MRAVVQRVLKAGVSAEGGRHAEIGPGLLVLLGVAPGDGDGEIDWMSRKISALRIFNDPEGKMNLSLRDTGGDAMVVSQFTLYADTTRGNRPGFSGSAGFDEALPIYEHFIEKFEQQLEKPVKTGWYGAEMHVSLVNDGPVTLLIDTPEHS